MFAVLYIPAFPLQAALRYEPALRDQAAAIVDDTEKPARILQFTRAARRAGLRDRMTPSQALARCPALQIRHRSREQERMAAAALLQCAACASPCIEATGEGICTLDWKGLPPAAFPQAAQTLLGQLRRQELIAKIGIAATPGLALLAARNARAARPIFQVTCIEDLHALPISALDPSPDLHRTLRRLGIRRLGEFHALPPDGIAARFGPEGLLHWQCIAGKTTRLLELVTAPEVFEEAIEFEQEIELLEPLLFMLRRFLECIAERLAAAWLVAATLDLRIGFAPGTANPRGGGGEQRELEGGRAPIGLHTIPDYTRAFPIPAPTRDVETLFRMLFTHLESFQSPHPIKSLRIAARPCKPVKEQLGLFETSLRDPNQFHQTLARLSALVGADRAGVPVKENTLRPDAFRLQTPAFPAPALPRKTAPSRGLALRRFRPPRPARVFTVNHRPASLTAEGVNTPLGESSGPWITSGDWWDLHAWGRSEWEVESADGRLYRVFRDGEAWYLEGVYD